jgi:lipoprotein-anchoring transpeptidase ErfK/SrfK
MPLRLATLDPALSEEAPDTAEPHVAARVDLSDQRMYVYVDDMLVHVFKVSTGRKGYGTPTGRYRAQWLSAYHRSRKYDWAPMPWSVFFNGGYAVHGTTDIRRLGRPASHGCVRLHPNDAKIFFSLVRESGKDNTQIAIVR